MLWRCLPWSAIVWSAWVMLAGGPAYGQFVPVVDRLSVSADDSSTVDDANIGRFADRDRVYSPARQNLRFRLVYRGLIDSSTVLGGLSMRNWLPREQREDSLVTYLSFAGSSFLRQSLGSSQVDALVREEILGAPVRHDGGILRFPPDSLESELFQVFSNRISSFRGPEEAALNMRPTALAVDGDALWFAGVFPGTPPEGVIARRKDGEWTIFSDAITGETVYLDKVLVTDIDVSDQDIWMGTVGSGLLRFHKADSRWFSYHTGDGLGGDGIPAVAVEDANTVWIGVKDSLKGRGVDRIRLQGDSIAVTHFGGLPSSRVPFPSTEVAYTEDPDFPDFVQVLLADSSLTLREVIQDSTQIPQGADRDSVIAAPFPSAMRIPNPNPGNAPDVVHIGFPRIVSATELRTPAAEDTVRFVFIPSQMLTVNTQGGPVVVAFPPAQLSIPADSLGGRDGIPDSIDVSLPPPIRFEVKGAVFHGIFLQPQGHITLSDSTLDFPFEQVIDLGGGERIPVEISAAGNNVIKLKFAFDDGPDSLLAPLSSQGLRIANPARPAGDPEDFVFAPLPDTIRAVTSEGADTVRVSLRGMRVRVSGRSVGLPDLLRYRRANTGVPDSLRVPFPRLVRIPNPGEVGGPDLTVEFFQPPEDSVITAISIDGRGDKWIGTGGSGLARLRADADDEPADTLWDVLPVLDNSLRSAIIFSLEVEEGDGASDYIWAGTDRGVLRLEVDDTVMEPDSLVFLYQKTQEATRVKADAEARDVWLYIFKDKYSQTEMEEFKAQISADTTQGNQILGEVQEELDEIMGHIELFSSDNSPMPDNAVRDLFVQDQTKWIATAKGLAALRDDKTGGIHHWQLYTAHHYGGVQDSITAVAALGDDVWMGRLPTWYSDVIWRLRDVRRDSSDAWWDSTWGDSSIALERIRPTVHFINAAGDPVARNLSVSFTLDAEPPVVRSMSPSADTGGTETDAVRVDTVLYSSGDEISATIDDGVFGPEGIDSVRVYINPLDPDAPDAASLINPLLYRFGGSRSLRVYRSLEDSLIRHNFSFRPSPEWIGTGVMQINSRNTIVLEVVDKAGNRSWARTQFYLRDLSDETEDIPLFLNFPNPFGKGPTLFQYALKAQSDNVTLRIFDLSGTLVNVLVRNESRVPGVYQEVWDGRNSFGESLANGVYLCELEAGNERRYTKAVILR